MAWTSHMFEDVNCEKSKKSGDICDWPECDCPVRRPRGTFACPICGESTPHHHDTKADKLAKCSGCNNPICEDCFTPEEVERSSKQISYSCPNGCDDYQNIKTGNPFANCGRCGSRLRGIARYDR